MPDVKDDIDKFYTKEDVDKLMFAVFAKNTKQILIDLTKNNRSSLSFQKFSKEKIIDYLKDPVKNEKNLRDASIYMYNNSCHYRRLILYYALMPIWTYTLSLIKFDIQKAKSDAILKQYVKVSQIVDNMNLQHELPKMSITAFREDVFYGVVLETTDSFYIQKINPNICELSSIEDGVYNFAVDMSKIKEDELQLYPPEFTSMWNTYKSSGQKKQEVPSKISACFKVNEDLPYPIPMFSGTMVSLHDIEDYKQLKKARTEINNYKMVNMQIPTKDGEPTMIWDDVVDYYNQLQGAVPEGVGLAVSPMKLDSIDFENSSGLSETDEVFKTEQQFWSSTGTSPLLFGGGNKNSAASLRLSIKSDEMIVINFMKQVERWINRRLKNISGSTKFKINILPITRYNQEDMAKLYKEAATLGLPTKLKYNAVLETTSTDVEADTYLETEILKLQDKFIPLSSSYTQPSQTGRPTSESKGEDLTESGEQTKEDDQNNAR